MLHSSDLTVSLSTSVFLNGTSPRSVQCCLQWARLPSVVLRLALPPKLRTCSNLQPRLASSPGFKRIPCQKRLKLSRISRQASLDLDLCWKTNLSRPSFWTWNKHVFFFCITFSWLQDVNQKNIAKIVGKHYLFHFYMIFFPEYVGQMEHGEQEEGGGLTFEHAVLIYWANRSIRGAQKNIVGFY